MDFSKVREAISKNTKTNETILEKKQEVETKEKKTRSKSKSAERVQDKIKAFAVNSVEEEKLNRMLLDSGKSKLSEFVREKVLNNFSSNLSDEDIIELINLSKDSKVLRRMLSENKIYY